MAAPSDPADPTLRREKAIWQGATASLVAKVVAALCGLAQVPVAVNYLGPELFGLWMTLTSALTLMAFADFGIGAGVQNETAAALGRGVLREAQAILANGVALLGVVAAVLLVVLGGLVFIIPWQAVLSLRDELQAAEARRGLAVLAVLFCLNLPLTAVARLAFGAQLGWLANAWYAAINLLTLLAVLASTGLKLGFVAFVALTAAPQLLGHALLAVHLLKKLGWSAGMFAKPDRASMRRLWRAGLPFTLPQLGALALTSCPPVVISAVLGPAAVTPYNLCQRLIGLFSVLQQVLLTQLWPAYTEARARGDHAWLRRTYRRSIALTAGCIALPQLTFGLWGPWAVAVWSHEAVRVATPFALLCGLHGAALAFGQPPAFLLNAFGRMRGQATYGIFAVAFGLAAMPWALRIWGLPGAVGILSVAWLLVFLPWIYRDASKALQEGEGVVA
jgi:O-antigen/teichoic acid export membrane protein